MNLVSREGVIVNSMYIRLENWTLPFTTSMLNSRKIVHGDHIIKAFSSVEDPRSSKMYGRDSIRVFDSNPLPFREDEIFNYLDRRQYTGHEIEQHLNSLNLGEIANQHIRSLFRFSNLPETNFTQGAMQLKTDDGSWLIEHPLDDIDGWNWIKNSPKDAASFAHLDIFLPDSLEALTRLLGTANLSNAEGLINFDEIKSFQHRKIEGQLTKSGKEN